MVQLNKRDGELGRCSMVEAVEMVYMKGVVMVFAMILLMVGMPAGVAAQSEDGLVGEWHFDGDAKDSSGNGNDGTVYGATFVDGVRGQALSFDGVDDYVEVPRSNNLDLNGKLLTDYTIEFWFKTTCLNCGIFSIVKGSSFTAGSDRHISLYDGNLCQRIWNNQVICTSGTSLNLDINQETSGNIKVICTSCTNYADSNWHYVTQHVQKGIGQKIYVDGVQKVSGTKDISDFNWADKIWIGFSMDASSIFFNGLIDEVRIYNRALSAEEIKAHYEQGSTALTIKKDVSLYSIRQYQTTNVTVHIKNIGTSEIRDIEVVDSTNSNLELIGGDFPNPKKYNSLSPGESRDIQYVLKSKESGTFILNPANVSYVDNTGNIKVVISDPVSLTVIPTSEGSPEISSPSDIGTSSAVLLHGEKTDVVLGEDILLKLSAVNLITKPQMSVQVMIYPPSGMSVTGSEFVESGAGIYTTTYTLNPGAGKDIEVHIKTNQVGDFNAKGRIIYYFDDDKVHAEDHTLNLPIKVRKEIGSDTTQAQTSAQKSIPGFELFTGISGLFLLAIILKWKR
jgi:hypothetical protein